MYLFIDRHHFDNPVYSTAFTGSPMASINTSSHPLRGRISGSAGGNSESISLNNSRVVNRFAVVGNAKNVNSERERLGVSSQLHNQQQQPMTATTYLENDEEEQDTISDRGEIQKSYTKCLKISLKFEIR